MNVATNSLQNQAALRRLQLRGLEGQKEAAHRKLTVNPTAWCYDGRIKRRRKDGSKYYVCRVRMDALRKIGITRKKSKTALAADAYGAAFVARLERFRVLIEKQAVETAAAEAVASQTAEQPEDVIDLVMQAEG